VNSKIIDIKYKSTIGSNINLYTCMEKNNVILCECVYVCSLTDLLQYEFKTKPKRNDLS